MENVHTDTRVQRIKDKSSGLCTKSPGFSLFEFIKSRTDLLFFQTVCLNLFDESWFLKEGDSDKVISVNQNRDTVLVFLQFSRIWLCQGKKVDELVVLKCVHLFLFHNHVTGLSTINSSNCPFVCLVFMVLWGLLTQTLSRVFFLAVQC